MAYPVTVSIGTGNKVSLNYQSHEVSLTVTYQLEREDIDLLRFIEDKAPEIEKAHSKTWRLLRETRAADEAAQQPDSKMNLNGHEAARPPSSSAANPNDQPRAATQAVSDIADTVENGTRITTEPPAPMAGETTPSPSGNRAGRLRQRLITESQKRAIELLVKRIGQTEDDLRKRIELRFGKSKLSELSELQASNLLLELQRREREVTNAARTPVQSQGGTTHGKQTSRSTATAR